jgi:ketosteroid isomerase-like protein
MKAALIIASVFLCWSAIAAPPNRATDSVAVEKAERLWMSAMQHRDVAALNGIVASNFALAGLDDLERPPITRAAWIDNTLHHLKIDTFVFRKLTVTVFGDVAIARSTFNWSGSFDGEAFNDTSVLVDTWVRRGVTWRVVSRLVGDSPAAAPPQSKQ